MISISVRPNTLPTQQHNKSVAKRSFSIPFFSKLFSRNQEPKIKKSLKERKAALLDKIWGQIDKLTPKKGQSGDSYYDSLDNAKANKLSRLYGIIKNDKKLDQFDRDYGLADKNEDTQENSLYLTQVLGKGIYNHGYNDSSKIWQEAKDIYAETHAEQNTMN
ncbi:MAG: hypothetical protein GY821_05980 [Gammaproteobacteria bacterium]|nr:hypothetical protein [Gammaproteobacteria bacterium]